MDSNHGTFYDKDIMEIYFPEEKITEEAKIIEEYCDPTLDIAFLQLKIKQGKKLSDYAAVAKLDDNDESLFGHDFASIGFRKAEEFAYLSAHGEIRIPMRRKNEEGREIELIQLYSDEIEEGMSGAPDLKTGRVVGIISLHYGGNDRIPERVDTRLNFAIPISAILEGSKAASVLTEKNVGLSRFNNFIELIGKSESLLYDRFEEVYVPPIEYPEIEKTLKEYRCVFITGTAEYGKTYTSINLLWEYYE